MLVASNSEHRDSFPTAAAEERNLRSCWILGESKNQLPRTISSTAVQIIAVKDTGIIGNTERVVCGQLQL